MPGRAKASKSVHSRFSDAGYGLVVPATAGTPGLARELWTGVPAFAGMTKCRVETNMERGHQIDIKNVAYFCHDYDDEHADLRHLYEQAKRDQWNAATDIDWGEPLDTDGGLI